MPIRTFGSGFDPNSGWAPDDSTEIPWNPETEITQPFRGGGQGFGPGGFSGNPRLVGPSTGQSGVSLSSVPGGGGQGAINPDEVLPPTNRTIRPGMSVGRWTNPFTNAHINPTTGAPELLPQGGPGTFPRLIGKGVRKIPGVGQIIDAVTPSDELAPASMDEANPGFWSGRPSGRPMSEPMPPQRVTPSSEPIVRGPVPVDPKTGLDWSGGGIPRGMPGRDVTPAQRGMPWPDTGVAPAQRGMPWPDTGVAPPQRGMPWAGNNGGRPAGVGAPVAGPAVTAQQPNLGNYNPFTTFDRPNMSPQNSMAGRQGAPKMGMLDLSHLFGGGGQAAPAAAAAPPLPPPRPAEFNQPSRQVIEPGSRMSRAPGTMGPLQKGSVWPIEMGPKRRFKGSSSSQTGGY